MKWSSKNVEMLPYTASHSHIIVRGIVCEEIKSRNKFHAWTENRIDNNEGRKKNRRNRNLDFFLSFEEIENNRILNVTAKIVLSRRDNSNKEIL